MILIFTENKQSANTYAEILEEYTPVVTSKKSDFLLHLPEAQIVIIDNKANLLDEIIQQDPYQLILFIGDKQPENENVIYLEKPLSSSLLLSKVKLLQARIEKGLLTCFSTPHYTFNGTQRLLNNIRLTQKEAEMIEYLWENKDRIISKEELLKEIFGYKEGVETHTVETHIYKLRQKINDDENGLIYTKEGGYTINLK
jgi:DNA-binding response OmpR family regulator